jgi:hypothetical protein
VKRFRSLRIVVARSATGNDAPRASVAPRGRAGTTGCFEVGDRHPVEAIATVRAAPLAGRSSAPSVGSPRRGRDEREPEAAEQRRWLPRLGPPPVIEALSVGLVFGTGKESRLALGLGPILATVLLVRLMLRSDADGPLDSTTSRVGERADAVTAATGIVGAPR